VSSTPSVRPQPLGVVDEPVEEEGVGLGHRVVSQVAELEGQLGVHAAVVLRVAALVQQRHVVVAPAGRRDHEVDLAGRAHGRAERARRLARARLHVEHDSVLGVDVDAQPRHRRLIGRQQSLAGEAPIGLGEAEEAGQVAAPGLAEADAHRLAQRRLDGPL
jgi:hypothetical protein